MMEKIIKEMSTTGLTVREFRQKILEIETVMAEEKQVELPVLHDFAPGVYLRRILMPEGTLVVGKTHKTEHLNIILSGSASVLIDCEVRYLQAPHIFVSGVGIKKILYIHKEMVWATVHPTKETDPEKLEMETVYTEEEEKQLLIRE